MMKLESNNMVIEPAHITLKVKSNNYTSYKIFGYARNFTYKGIEYLQLQLADRRKKPTLTIPVTEVLSLSCEF